jgi:hypothetical protein
VILYVLIVLWTVVTSGLCKGKSWNSWGFFEYQWVLRFQCNVKYAPSKNNRGLSRNPLAVSSWKHLQQWLFCDQSIGGSCMALDFSWGYSFNSWVVLQAEDFYIPLQSCCPTLNVLFIFFWLYYMMILYVAVSKQDFFAKVVSEFFPWCILCISTANENAGLQKTSE